MEVSTINRIIIAGLLLCLLTSCTSLEEEDDGIPPYIGMLNSIKKNTNYQYERIYTQADFEAFLRGENPTLIDGYPELLYDDTILLDYFESKHFYRTEAAYYLVTYQHPQKYVMYRFQQVGDYIVSYIKYDYVRS